MVLVLQRGMEMFSHNRRMDDVALNAFALQLLDDYPHESLADINVFIRRAAIGTYDQGEFYANVDGARLGGWWRRYLEEKAEARERAARRERDEAKRKSDEALAEMPGLGEAVQRSAVAYREEKKEQNMLSRVTRMMKHAPRMTDDQLREAWKLNPEAPVRKVLMAEAMFRGLPQKKLDQTQNS